MIRLRKRIGQSTLEYAILIAVVVSGLIIMQVYMKRGLQGRLRGATDDIGEQYSPGLVTSSYSRTSKGFTTEDLVGGTTTTSRDITQDKTGEESVEDFSQELWP